MQAVPPFWLLQTAPHVPQFVVVFSAVSQPFTGSPSQFPKPAAQTGAHRPATHEVVPCPFEQVFPHAPQLVVVA